MSRRNNAAAANGLPGGKLEKEQLDKQARLLGSDTGHFSMIRYFLRQAQTGTY